MKVAVPLFGSRVSPRFDCGSALLLAEVSGGAVGPTEQVADQSTNALERVARLRELGVDAVICGAITMFLWRHLTACGIQVYSGAFCESAEALEALARGELRADAMQRNRRRMRRRARRQ